MLFNLEFGVIYELGKGFDFRLLDLQKLQKAKAQGVKATDSLISMPLF